MSIYINKEIIKENFRKIENTYNKTPAVVLKSNAYGLGIENILPIILETSCKVIFVRDINEAICIRRIAPTSNIQVIVLNSVEEDTQLYYREHNIIPVINDLNEIILYKDFFRQTPCALNIDIGMNRTGINWETVLENIDLLKSLPLVHIMAHLHITYHIVIDPVNFIQRERFQQIVDLFPSNIPKSLASSNVVEFGEEFIYDMPRIGKMLYGVTHKNKIPVEIAFVLEEKISLVRYVKKNEIVGYNGYKILEDSYVAILNVGYAQGISLYYMHNHLTVNINHMNTKYRCQIISISMEYTMLHIPLSLGFIPKIGDIVTFFPDGFVATQENSSTYYLEQLLRFSNLDKKII